MKTSGFDHQGEHLLSQRPNTDLMLGSPDWKGMSLCIEDKLVQVQEIHIVREKKEQILEGLPQEKTLHLVPGLRVAGILHIVDGGVATRWNPCELVEVLENFPAPVLVFGVTSKPIEIEETFHRFWS